MHLLWLSLSSSSLSFVIVTKTIPCQVLRKDEDKEKTVDASKVKEASLEVLERKCSKKICHFWLTITGEPLLVLSILEVILVRGCQRNMLSTKFDNFSENWILPFAVLFAMLAYAVLAIVFYNKDG